MFKSFLVLFYALFFLRSTAGYQLLFSSDDDVRQVCSGMYGSKGDKTAAIEIIFSHESTGQLALVVYEYEDSHYLGKKTGLGGDASVEYVCTVQAVTDSLCVEAELGQFISTAPANSSSIFTTSVQFSDVNTRGPFKYPVLRTGYYCVGTVPLSSDDFAVSAFDGVVDFQNIFPGHLSASEYPKLYFYLGLCFIYIIGALTWVTQCFRNRHAGVLPIQHYITATLIFLVIEMFVSYFYYAYMNSSGHANTARALMLVVALLTAARNSISLFMLLLTSMGWGITRPSLGPVMLKIRLLAFIHFVFGVLYSIGTVSVSLEQAGFFLFFFILPLSLSLTGFLLWIMYALNATIDDLDARKQSYKKLMFTRLYRILLGAAIVVCAFFVISGFVFSSRLSDDYAPRAWKTQWILLDGWLSALYLVVLTSIAYLWRPTGNNARLAMSSELAGDEAEADEADRYDIEALERGEGIEGKSMIMRGMDDDDVVFDLGDAEDDDDIEEDAGRAASNRLLRKDGDVEQSRPPSYHDRRE